LLPSKWVTTTLEKILALKGAVSLGQQGMTKEHWVKKKFEFYLIFYLFIWPTKCKA